MRRETISAATREKSNRATIQREVNLKNVALVNSLQQQNATLRERVELEVERVHQLEQVVADMRTAAVVGANIFSRRDEAASTGVVANAAVRVQAVVRGRLARQGWESQEVLGEAEGERRAGKPPAAACAAAPAPASASTSAAAAPSPRRAHFATGVGGEQGRVALAPPRRTVLPLAAAARSSNRDTCHEDGTLDDLFNLEGLLDHALNRDTAGNESMDSIQSLDDRSPDELAMRGLQPHSALSNLSLSHGSSTSGYDEQSPTPMRRTSAGKDCSSSALPPREILSRTDPPLRLQEGRAIPVPEAKSFAPGDRRAGLGVILPDVREV